MRAIGNYILGKLKLNCCAKLAKSVLSFWLQYKTTCLYYGLDIWVSNFKTQPPAWIYERCRHYFDFYQSNPTPVIMQVQYVCCWREITVSAHNVTHIIGFKPYITFIPCIVVLIALFNDYMLSEPVGIWVLVLFHTIDHPTAVWHTLGIGYKTCPIQNKLLYEFACWREGGGFVCCCCYSLNY